MPELPDITVYVERLQDLLQGQLLQRAQVLNAFVLRTALPPLAAVEGQPLVTVQRLGKRIVLGLANGHFIVIHLMIAGRLRWLPAPPPAGSASKAAGRTRANQVPAKISQAVFHFACGQLVLTEAGTTRRASIHLVADAQALAAMDPGGIDVMNEDATAFARQLQRENHTLKRSLTDPRLFSGIGNAYSDEILHRARLSPLALSRALTAEATQRLFVATHAVLFEWTQRLRAEALAAGGWPDQVTAFHPEMAVHGRFGQPCPVCAAPVQRIVHANNETNYCARCQTDGTLLADRALSRLLKDSWPRHIDDP
jgi:formamidopyrimidine-DNA glycosylase